MKAKRAIKELEKQIRKDADNLVLRLKLAAAYREVGRTEDAVALYRSVAIVYHSQGRLVQAIAVCKSVLEIEPSQRETQALLAELDHMRSLQAAQEAMQAGAARETFAPIEAVDEGDEDPMPVPSIAGALRRPGSPSALVPSLASEFARPSGLTPANADPDVRMPEEMTPGSLTPGQQMRQLRTQAQQRPPQKSTRRGFPAARPGIRSSSGSISAYTPLPEPLALHDAVDDSLADIPLDPPRPPPSRQPPPTPAVALTQTARGRAPGAELGRVPIRRAVAPTPSSPPGSRRPAPRQRQPPPGPRQPPPEPPALPPPDEDDDALTRVVGDEERVSALQDDAPTTIAPDLDFSGDTSEVPRRLGDDDAPTTIADESGLLGELPLRPALSPAASRPGTPPPVRHPSPTPSPRMGEASRAAPSFFDRETRQLGVDEAARLVDGFEPDFDDLPTPPPLGEPPDSLPTPLPVELPTPPPMEPPRTRRVPDLPPMISPPRRRAPPTGPEDLVTPVDLTTPAGAASMPESPDDLPTPIPGFAPRGLNQVTVAPVGDSSDADPRATVRIPIPAELEQFQRGDRLLDIAASEPSASMPEPRSDEDEDEDEDSEPTSPGPTNQLVTAVSRPREPELADNDEELELDRAFPRPFADTIDRLGPDGAVIEMPLSIFSALPDDALAEMARRMTLRHYRSGDVVLREGEPGDACFVLAHGEVRVLKRDPLNPRGDLIEVARLGSGALFGEFALLADRRRHATVQAVDSSDIYEIPRRLLRELAATFPAVGPLLEQFYRERLLATLLSTAPFFKPLPEERRGELLARFEPIRAESGQRIVSEGEPAGGLFLIVLGSVEITKRVSDKRSVLLATLGEGAYFGEMSLLKGGVACASATAVGPTELAMMSPRDFYEVVADNPKLWDEVRREANRRQLENNQIVTGETNVV